MSRELKMAISIVVYRIDTALYSKHPYTHILKQNHTKPVEDTKHTDSQDNSACENKNNL